MDIHFDNILQMIEGDHKITSQILNKYSNNNLKKTDNFLLLLNSIKHLYLIYLYGELFN